MSLQKPTEISELLIVSVTPPNLERGALWFKENLNSIKKAIGIHPWWQQNAIHLDKDEIVKISELARRLSDLGYERASEVPGKGIFAVRGGIIEIWPINEDLPYLLEFVGNKIETIHAVPKREAIEAKPRLYRGFASIEKLPEGSYVVHVDHGIGIYRGTTENQEARIKNYGKENSLILDSKFLILEYAPARKDGPPDILYVPVEQKDRVTPYVGFETPRIHRLGGTVWFNTKRKAREDAEKLAKELLALYAKRHNAQRPPHHGDETLENLLRETFSFNETGDQLRAEDEILKDLEKDQPMDRILCGDVGFGKTEIAIRAALRVIVSGKQVAVLSPTTILAAQHERTFLERFNQEKINPPSPPFSKGGTTTIYPPFEKGGLGGILSTINIAVLSRLTSPKDERRTLKELADGKIDCVIGTHRLLSKDVIFKNLGLVIIDEEQRFGVKQKERFKEMRSEIDLLSLSATPIPRTLSLALAKLRDLSIIDTPPPERLPIQTFVLPYSLKTIRQAIEHELSRGGQIYFLHNRIETIEKAKEKISKALKQIPPLPPLKRGGWGGFNHIGIIHGRMKEKEIARTMDQFRNGDIKILVATTIIENGLDISSANTLIVDEATRLGLAEAHQLRGRIGRGAVQAFAYFLFKPKHLTDKSAERLEALQEYAELGAGYQIALRDLEIRGAGNVLGKEQSGTINKVGLNLYCQMLAEAVEKTKDRGITF